MNKYLVFDRFDKQIDTIEAETLDEACDIAKVAISVGKYPFGSWVWAATF